MVIRCLFGVFVVSMGLVALLSTTRSIAPLNRPSASSGGSRLHDSDAVAVSGVSRTLLRPVPAPNLCFSLN
jgi:hypothetical protein